MRVAFERSNRFFGFCDIAVVMKRDLRFVLRKLPSNCAANALRSAGDEYDFVREVHNVLQTVNCDERSDNGYGRELNFFNPTRQTRNERDEEENTAANGTNT